MGLGSKLKGLGDRVQAELGVGASSGGVPHGGYQQQAWQPPPQQQGAAWQSPQQQVQQAFAPYNPIRHGKVHGGYFTSWSIYPPRNFTPAELPYADLTHIFYAFADVNPTNGTVFLVDPWADEQTPFDSPAPEDELRGNFGRLLRAKREHRTTKVSISVGGWTFKDHFAPVACDAKKRAEFVRSALTLLEDYGLDGIDIDWEYPENGKEASDFVLLLREMRAGLDAHAAYKGEPRYLLTIASPAGEKKLKLLRVREMDEVLDLWNVMSYDFAGSWNTTANHQANLRGPAPSCEATISLFQSMGVSPNKLVLGIPLYGRSFTKCAGAGSGYEGLGKGTLEKGVYDYRALPLPGAVEVSDPIGAAWCRTPDGEWVTYDSVETAADKAGYVNWAGLAGTFYWDMSGDAVGARSIVQTVRRGLGQLEMSPNHLSFPQSRFANVREGRP